MEILPPRIKNLLYGLTDEISAAVGIAFSSVIPILERNESPFFPDYTDHGIAHIRSVLSSCELIVAEDSWNEFTRDDAVVLVLATLTHDLGMLVNKESFCALVESTLNDVPQLMPNDEPWQVLWREYQLDARRFDGATLLNIVGSPEPVSVNELNPKNLTEKGIKITGEFLRRHHHRLAHEIVVYGMPSENGRIPLFDGIAKHLREMAGIIARSHGVSIRECIDILVQREKTSHRAFRNIHTTYLMTLVRLADYLDLDAERAPSSILSVKSLKSPISRREWWSHKAIVDCHSYADDPECLHVIVEPSALPDVATFSVIEEKVKGIQKEIDASWSVLGEVYGRFPPLNRLNLKIRRIKSDIRQPSIISQLPFVPHKASLESARADLLKLLIEPLYGDHPGVGIRELIQNALDAVRELEFILSGPSTITHAEREPLEGDVIVNFEKDDAGSPWVVISDRGIGMTWVTVCKYYLTAGASFRQSDAWKKRFTDESGTSQILRSGRFGIGVLAAFLIGDRVKVSTRHYDQPEGQGVEFEFGLEDTIIEIKWLNRNVGTTVKVRTSESVIKRLMRNSYSANNEEWDWYCLDKPVVVRKDVDGNTIKQKYVLPGIDTKLPVGFHKIKIQGLQEAHWTYSDKAPSLVCNGILVPQARISLQKEFSFTHLKLDEPKISIYDPDGRLPLNLARNSLANSYSPLNSELTDDLCKNFIAYCLLKGPKGRILSDDLFDMYTKPNYPGFRYNQWMSFGIYFDTVNGFGLSDPWNISNCSSQKGLLICKDGQTRISKETASSTMLDYSVVFGNKLDGTLGSFDYWHRMLALTTTTSYEQLIAFKGMKVSGIRTLMSLKSYNRFVLKQPKYIIKSTAIEMKTAERVTWTVGKCGVAESSLSILADDMQQHSESLYSLTEIYFSPSEEILKPGRIAQCWKDIIGGPIIPFDMVDRQAIISKLDDNLKRHIEQWSVEKSRRTR